MRSKNFQGLMLAVVLMIFAVGQPVFGGEVSIQAINFFSEHISPADGDRCMMVPSCSHYAAGAVKKHGALIGWVMACDRLVRCGTDT